MSVVRLLSALTALALALPASAATPLELEPRNAGPYAVACSNVEQDYARATDAVSSYWEGTRDQRSRYIAELLVAPQNAIRYTVRAPNDGMLFRNFRNRDVEFVALVCYPTRDDNLRAAFALPDGDFLPAMQRGDEAPIFAEPCTGEGDVDCNRPHAWPLMMYSHGLGGSPLSSGYIETLLRFASHGYIVAAPFHADPRFSRITIDELDDVLYVLSRGEELVEMQAMRPLAIQGLLDYLLNHPDYAPHVDPQRIAGFGASMGGQSMMLVAGAELTYDLFTSRSRQVLHDRRLKAIVTFVPYSGINVLPAFGDDQHGVSDVSVPYLGIAGTEDRIAPRHTTKNAVEQLQGTRYLVAVEGMGHGSNPEVMDEAYSWYLTFLDANLNGDRHALSRLYRATRVAGGVNDFIEIAVQSSVPALPGETVVREFYHSGLNHFFLTAGEGEANGLIAHPESGWLPTGYAFAAAPANMANGSARAVCRFYGDPVIGPNSHFYTASPLECNGLIDIEARTPPGQPAWHLEGLAFAINLADTTQGCPDDAPFPVWRTYNRHAGEFVNEFRLDPNHRYLTDVEELQAMSNLDWQIEGIAFCTKAPLHLPPPADGLN